MNFKAQLDRFAHAPLLVGSFLFLTAAKGDGCTTVIVEEEPAVEECGEGFHVELVCGGAREVEPSVGAPDEPRSDVAIAPSECVEVCVADERGCAPGEHLETQCASAPCIAEDGVDCPDIAYCEDVCVPDSLCPPGTVETISCPEDTMAGCAPEPGMPCEIVCVPAGACDPGQHLETVCAVPDCPEGEACPAVVECSDICVDDTRCPEGTMEVVTCGEGEGAPCVVSCEPIEPQPGGSSPGFEGPAEG